MPSHSTTPAQKRSVFGWQYDSFIEEPMLQVHSFLNIPQVCTGYIYSLSPILSRAKHWQNSTYMTHFVCAKLSTITAAFLFRALWSWTTTISKERKSAVRHRVKDPLKRHTSRPVIKSGSVLIQPKVNNMIPGPQALSSYVIFEVLRVP